VPLVSFVALTKIPILILYGDNIPEHPVDLPAQDSWRARVAMARAWRDTVNRHGGDVTLIELPRIGIGEHPFPVFRPQQPADRRSGPDIPLGQATRSLRRHHDRLLPHPDRRAFSEPPRLPSPPQ
jgi:hypothetical protein